MITLSSDKASKPVQVRCIESLREQGQWLADTIAGFDGRGRGLADGVSVEVGWVLYTLRAQADSSLLVCEPDFATNPFKALREDVTASLTVLVGQIDLLRVIDLKPEPCRFDQSLIFRKGSLTEQHIFARRSQPTATDSGWYVGPTQSPFGAPKADELDAIPLYELIGRRPQVLLALALPVGYMVVWNGPELVALMNPEGRNLWHTAA